MVHSLRTLLSLLSISLMAQSLPNHPSRSTPTVPIDVVNNTSAASPLPTPSTTLKYIGLGLGTQNYTCNSTSGKYVAVGALARLFDATDYLSNNPDKMGSLPQAYLDIYTGLQCSKDPSDCVELDDLCEEEANLQSKHPLAGLGQHYFTASGTPTFDLHDAPDRPFMYSKKVGDVPALSAENVNWLYLSSNGSSVNHGVDGVYRVETAGGMQRSSCQQGDGTIYVPYAAEYWFYG
jgi:hypothetical protein